ncbi:MAG: hypothetical protein J6S85_09325 [Methanobrevibacter sp.]|nr:hypothetical protein [Methanobrevibacter sp.]
MEVTQIADIVNQTTLEITGKEDLASSDLNKVVEIGSEVIDNDKTLDHYTNSLIDRIGKVVFVNRPYTGSTPSVMMDSWEYGAILEKIQYEGLPEAEDNDSWNLVDGQSYDPNVFHKPTVSAKFYSERRTFDIEMSFARRQIKTAFTSGAQIQAFFAMIETAISNGMTVKMDSLVQFTLANAIATIYSNKLTHPIQYYDLVTAYRTATGDSTVTPENAMVKPEFTRWASMTIKRVIARMRRLNTLFNTGEKYRHTPKDRLHLILHSDFTAAAEAYLYGDTYHNEFVKLPQAEEVPFWQGSGKSFNWSDTSKIIVTPTGGDSPVTVNNIVGIAFDRDALGVSNLDRRVTTNWNPKAEFTNNWYKFDAGYFNDFNENIVVFTLGEPTGNQKSTKK